MLCYSIAPPIERELG